MVASDLNVTQIWLKYDSKLMKSHKTLFKGYSKLSPNITTSLDFMFQTETHQW